jgi:hypothetical protein
MQHVVLAEVALEKCTSAIGSIGRMSSAMIVPSMPPSRCASLRRASLLRAYWLQLPGAAPRSTITWPGGSACPARRFLELVGRARAIALPLRHFTYGSLMWSCSQCWLKRFAIRESDCCYLLREAGLWRIIRVLFARLQPLSGPKPRFYVVSARG